MKLPKHIFILGYKYKVLRKLPTDHKFAADPPEGLFCEDEEFIFVSDKIKENKVFVTFLHECFHGIWYHSGHTLNFKHKEEDTINESASFGIVKILEQMGIL